MGVEGGCHVQLAKLEIPTQPSIISTSNGLFVLVGPSPAWTLSQGHAQTPDRAGSASKHPHILDSKPNLAIRPSRSITSSKAKDTILNITIFAQEKLWRNAENTCSHPSSRAGGQRQAFVVRKGMNHGTTANHPPAGTIPPVDILFLGRPLDNDDPTSATDSSQA